MMINIGLNILKIKKDISYVINHIQEQNVPSVMWLYAVILVETISRVTMRKNKLLLINIVIFIIIRLQQSYVFILFYEKVTIFFFITLNVIYFFILILLCFIVINLLKI